jgi:hypothetical protein
MAVQLLAVVFATAYVAVVAAADFTQPKRDPEFNRSCRRQDSLVKHAFGDLVPTSVNFGHRGCFKVVVHRLGLERPLTLAPVATVPYAAIEEMREAARKKPIVIGVVNVTYPQADQSIIPGVQLLMFDGARVRVLDAHGFLITQLDAQLGPVAADAKVDPVVGSFKGSPFSLSNIAPDGSIALYLQLKSGSREVKGPDGFEKAMLTFSIPGIVTDDDSPLTPLATPKPEEGKTAKAKE